MADKRHLRNLKRPGRGGFALVEQVIAAMVIALVSGGVIGSLIVSHASQIDTRHRVLAMSLARERMESLLDRSGPQFFDNLLTQVGTEPVLTLDPDTNTTASRATAITPVVGVQYLRATVTVTWNYQGTLHNEMLEMFVSQ
ncbi:MAG: hypothetical protein HYY14_04700 [Candidatus Omnitrophica bacterium]|nr:hypothetical protein [Candidatus Omnitrophota bacterium]